MTTRLAAMWPAAVWDTASGTRIASVTVKRTTTRAPHESTPLSRYSHPQQDRGRAVAVAEWLRAWDTRAMQVESMEAGGRELEPRPGHYNRMSF